MVLESEKGRMTDLLPLRHGRMVRSAFTFYRGSALTMAADLASTPSTGMRVQCCGDGLGVLTCRSQSRGLGSPEPREELVSSASALTRYSVSDRLDTPGAQRSERSQHCMIFLSSPWGRPVLVCREGECLSSKCRGIHGTLVYGLIGKRKYYPRSRV
jgi:hypothetical protein